VSYDYYALRHSPPGRLDDFGRENSIPALSTSLSIHCILDDLDDLDDRFLGPFEFDRCKRAIPPQPLPGKMNDHKLGGPLKDFMECHLDDDVLLIYKPLPGGSIKLLRVCTHADLKGPKAKVLAKQLKQP
jgi:hypothetical protein